MTTFAHSSLSTPPSTDDVLSSSNFDAPNALSASLALKVLSTSPALARSNDCCSCSTCCWARRASCSRQTLSPWQFKALLLYERLAQTILWTEMPNWQPRQLIQVSGEGPLGLIPLGCPPQIQNEWAFAPCLCDSIAVSTYQADAHGQADVTRQSK